MKKYLVATLSAILLISLLVVSGCGKKEHAPAAPTTPAPTTTTTTTTQPAATPASEPAKADTTKADAQKPAAEAPKPAVAEKTPFEKYLETLPGKLDPAAVAGKQINYQFNITDGHPGRYYVVIKDGKCTTGKGDVANPTLTINVGEQLWMDMRSDKVNGTTAYLTKKFTVDGDTGPLSNMKKYFPAK